MLITWWLKILRPSIITVVGRVGWSMGAPSGAPKIRIDVLRTRRFHTFFGFVCQFHSHFLLHIYIYRERERVVVSTFFLQFCQLSSNVSLFFAGDKTVCPLALGGASQVASGHKPIAVYPKPSNPYYASVVYGSKLTTYYLPNGWFIIVFPHYTSNGPIAFVAHRKL